MKTEILSNGRIRINHEMAVSGSPAVLIQETGVTDDLIFGTNFVLNKNEVQELIKKLQDWVRAGTLLRPQEAKFEIKKAGCTYRVREGEIRISLKGEGEDRAYYTNDWQDAMLTARAKRKEHDANGQNRVNSGERTVSP